MKTLPPGLQAHLDGGATTLAWCWRLARRDGRVLGFTDHDRDITFDGTTFEAAAGFTASEIKDAVGLAVDNLEVTSALQSDRLSEVDLAAGLYDDARVEIFRVNWQATDQRVLMRSGSLGEVKRGAGAFSAEVRGLAHYLQQPKGRLFQYTCDADLGDARCGVDLTLAPYRAAGTILAAHSSRRFLVAGLDGYADEVFTRGLFTMTSGAAAGLQVEIKEHQRSPGSVTLELWQAAGAPPLAGDSFVVTAGCDKSFATCKAKFANQASFRGFPHMPGNDFVTGYVKSSRRR